MAVLWINQGIQETSGRSALRPCPRCASKRYTRSAIGWPPNLAKAHAAILQVDVAVSFGGTYGDHARSVGKRLVARPVAFGGRRDPAVDADAHLVVHVAPRSNARWGKSAKWRALSTSTLATQARSYGELNRRSEREPAPYPNPFPISDC
jgi:hypothetical protein